ncbi:hypothetical protein BDW22DRAFT_1428355 [Trametopsis cervina]|nr:hypothetical protein BDW22DRAFT_1428355 [Trametopsis cervina]
MSNNELPWMVRALPWFNRLSLLIVSVFSAVVLYSNVNYIALTTNTDSFAYNGDGFPAPFSQFSLAVSIITIVTLMPMRLAGLLVSGSFLCTVFFEVLWLSILQIMWFAAGVWALTVYNSNMRGCDALKDIDAIADVCRDMTLDTAFGAVNFLLLLLYYLPLVILAASATSKGKPVWLESARRTHFGYDKEDEKSSQTWGSNVIA